MCILLQASPPCTPSRKDDIFSILACYNGTRGKPLVPITALEVCYISPLQQQGGSQGQRSRSRRTDRSSSDSSSGTAWDGFGEEQFRAGGPHLSEPPCETLRGIPLDHQYHGSLTGPQHLQLEQELLDLARETNPELNEIRFCGRRSLLEPRETPAVTVLFHGKRNGRGWIDVARKIRQRLHQKGLTQIKVEILDPRFDQRLKPHPCSHRDAIFPVWGDVVETILHSTDLSGVLTIGCYRIGSDDRNKSSPTILVGVDRKSTRDWKALREAPVHVLDRFELPDVAILLRKDTSALRQPTTDTPSAANCTKEVNLGYSLCPRKEQYSRGTFGGWVELRNPKTGAWVPFGLTCTHCVIPEEEYLSQAEKPGRNEA